MLSKICIQLLDIPSQLPTLTSSPAIVPILTSKGHQGSMEELKHARPPAHRF